MNLKKGLSLIAFGYLFTLVNLNLNMENLSINIMPTFVGWIMIFLALDALGSYAEGKGYLKWMTLIMVILRGVQWIAGILSPGLELSIMTTAAGILGMITSFLLFGILEKIAADYHSTRESTIHMLKILNLVLGGGFVLMGIGVMLSFNTTLIRLAAIFGLAALVAAIITLVALFGLRKEITAMEE